MISHPLRFLLLAVAGWMNQQQQNVIVYLQEDSKVLRQQLGKKQIRFTDKQRRCLAAKAKIIGRKLLKK